MKSKLRLCLCIGTALILSAIFASVFIAYSNPMQDQIYDLSLFLEEGEGAPPSQIEALGWTAYVQEGDVRTPLESDGWGCLTSLAWPGQTVYFSRVMQEELDSPIIQLGTVNRNFAVFLDGELLYTDCPEADNRIGFLTLPMRSTDRMEDVSISLPDDYVGRTLTIAQSTPAEAETPSMATRVIPATVKLSCSYAYESALISESFQAAFIGAACYVLGVILLAVFLRQMYLGDFDPGLLFLALAIFLSMSAYMYDTTYAYRYFGHPVHISTSLLCQSAGIAALLIFLSTRAPRLRPLPWCFTVVYVLCVLGLFLIVCAVPSTSSAISHGLWKVVDCLGGVSLVLILGLSWFWRGGHRFYRFFAPVMLILLGVYIAFRLILPDRGEFISAMLLAIRTLSLHGVAFPAASAMAVVSLMIVLVQRIRDEFTRHTEKRLMLEVMTLSQQRYENLRLHSEEVMMLRHDMNRHFQLLRQTTTDDKTAAYLDELIGQNAKIRPVIQSGHEMLDIILNSRLTIAAEAGVTVEVLRAEAPAHLPLTDAELCSLVMNLMDNAITAARTSGTEKPFIRLDLHVKNAFFVFVCENAADMAQVKEENEKAVPEHGLGLRIVRQIIARYGDLMQTESGADFYKVTLAVPLTQPAR